MRKFHVVAKENGKHLMTHLEVVAQNSDQAALYASRMMVGAFVITRIFAGAFLNPQF